MSRRWSSWYAPTAGWYSAEPRAAADRRRILAFQRLRRLGPWYDARRLLGVLFGPGVSRMTEAEWLVSSDALDMLGPAPFRPSVRKLRLVALSWWNDPFGYRELRGEPRSDWELACGELVERVVYLVEGQASPGEVQVAGLELDHNRPDLRYAVPSFAYDYLTQLRHEDAWAALAGCWRVLTSERHAPEDPDRADYFNLLRCDQLREIVGNPFRRVVFEPAWRTEAVVGLARGMYEPRDFALMPVLGDALEDAGCSDPDILARCRGDGPHVRGCWVVDLVLGKE